jgi:alpha-N-arabinofuranosidase
MMPADNQYGWRRDVVALLKELDSPVYRWPGGNFVSGYNWRDGIGDRDRRPPRKNPAWTGIEHNDVGLHEYMDLMELIGAEPFVAVNTGLGGAEEAANLVAYANAPASTEMGALRAANGRPLPYGISWWAIGNEMYGDWQLGHMPLDQYVLKHNRVVDAIRAVDPTVKPIAVGAAGEWSRQMMTSCAGHMDLLSEHLYWQDRDDLLEHVRQLPAQIRSVAETHRAYRRELPSLAGKDIRIAMDEWNYWYGPYEYGELGVRYFLQDALGAAAGLHEYFRNSDIYFMANYAQTVNVIGAIKATPTEAEMEPTGLVLALYRKHFGTVPVAAVSDVPELDVSAALTGDRTKLTLAVVNPLDEAVDLNFDLAGSEPAGPARIWVLTGADRYAGNRPGQPRGVDVSNRMLSGPPERILVPRLSVTLFEFPIR